MKTYLRIYRWSMQMKLRMGLYTFTAIFLKMVCNLLMGVDSIPIRELLTMWLTCLLFAVLESVIFPENSECTGARTALWLAAGNLCFIGGAVQFGWFAGVPVWGGVILVLFLELGLGLMWFGDRFVLKMDSAELTKQLRQYQGRGKA